MIVNCLICQQPVQAFQVLPRRALFNKPLSNPVPEAVANMGLAYCRECRHVSSRLESTVSLDELKQKVYGELYRNFVPTGLSSLQKAYTDFVGKWIAEHLTPSSNVLEIGCHDGYLLNLLAEGGHKCWGVEPSPFAQVAREKYNLPVINDFFDGAQFDAGSFDLVVVRHVVEHVDDPAKLVKEATRLLKGDGLLYVEVPNSYWSVEQTYFPEFHTDHVSYFTMASLHNLLSVCGINEVLHAETVWAYMKFPFLNMLARRGNHTHPGIPKSPRWFLDFRMDDLLDRFVDKFGRYERNLRSLLSGRKLAVWGSGSIGTQYAIDAGWSANEVTYVDINPANQGLRLSVTGHPVHAPESIKSSNCHRVLIASGWEEDVTKQAQPYVESGSQLLRFSDLIDR